MIEEGFDCKTLDTLIMATPKVTIEQSVGRILRKQKEERTIKPLVIDIYDLFANNLNKGKKRLTFYKKQKYRIKTYNVNDDQIPTCIVEIKNDKTKSSKTNQKTTYQF
jgi:superfamily II DNA or RNA helicase